MGNRANEIYPFKKLIVRELKKIESDPHNSDSLLRYYNNRVAEGVSDARVYKCITTLKRLSRMLGKPFAEATKDDFVRLIAGLESKGLLSRTRSPHYRRA